MSWSLLQGFLETAVTAAVIVIVLAGLLLYAWQRHLLFPSPKKNAVLDSPTHAIEPVEIALGGKMLQGRLALPRGAQPIRSALLYFQGRREHPTSIFRALRELPDQAVLCFHGAALGLAWRKPGERELVDDGIAVLDWWSDWLGLPPGDIAIAGRSLGSGLAVQVAAARPVRALVLISPHDRLLSAVRVRLPWLPAPWLRDRFESIRHIGRVRSRCLLVVGALDTTIPPDLSRALFADWRGALTEFVLPDCGHRGILKREDVHRAIGHFLRVDRRA